MLLGVWQRKRAERWRLGSAAEPAPVRPPLSTVSRPGEKLLAQRWKLGMCNFLTDPGPKEAKYLIVRLHFPLCCPALKPLAPCPIHTHLLRFTPTSSAHLASTSLQVSVGGWGLRITNFLPGNFLWWKLWGNFLSRRLLPRPDNGNCFKPAAQLLRGWHGSSLSSQSRGTSKGNCAGALESPRIVFPGSYKLHLQSTGSFSELVLMVNCTLEYLQGRTVWGSANNLGDPGLSLWMAFPNLPVTLQCHPAGSPACSQLSLMYRKC